MALVGGALGLRAWHAADPIRIGAVFPLSGNAAVLARQQELGVEIARDLVNADGGIDGRQVIVEVRDLERGQDASAVMSSLRAAGVQVVIGAYSSDLSIAASAAAADAGLVYWEAGAVADRLTGRGYAQVFRVGASGSNLGSNSASFAATQLATRLGKPATQLRLAIVAADDDYARSVADAAAATARADGMPIVTRLIYRLALPRWPSLMAALGSARPDVIVLASHIPDGIEFRRAMLAAGLKVGALIGSTMAECSPDFAGALGADAVGIFASDRPTGGFQADVLGPAARESYDRFASAWSAASPPAASASPSDGYGAEYAIRGPVEETAPGPTEEGLSGFTAGWALFHDVLPAAALRGNPDAGEIAAAARQLDLPAGSLPNGAGLRFSSAPATLGQNERAAAVIWQWQAVRSYAFVWPATYATGSIGFVPLSR
ncbi:MAG: ABC transporter substrate-binding protein [Chloroflexota bacterium]|nr:ABC transporter substrate-binding protein [Chloroflexota bacterium]